MSVSTALAPVTMREALSDPALLGAVLAGDSWRPWRILLIALMGEALTDDERVIFARLTGREREPLERVDEFWGIIGRRGGKSRAAAVLAIYQAIFVDHSANIVVGERPSILCLAENQKQSQVVYGYICGIIESTPLVAKLVTNKTADTLSLSNGIDITVRAASFRGLRGLTNVCIGADEAAFWYDESSGSANSDEEILAAVRPSLATTGGLLIVISSPYAKRGAVYEAWRKHYGATGDPRILVAQGASRDFNPSLPQSVVDRAMERDPASARAEYLGQFRGDLEAFVSREAVEACTERGVFERPPAPGVTYAGFVDPSGGSADSFTAAVGHRDGERIILDAVREVRPPFSPESVTRELASFFLSYRVKSVRGDRYAGEWPREQFRKAGVDYEPAAKPKSELFAELLPVVNSRRALLLDSGRLVSQLTALERRTSRGGRDSIDHPPSGHDDLANSVAGVIAMLAGAIEPGFLGYYRHLSGVEDHQSEDVFASILMQGPAGVGEARGASGRDYKSPTWNGRMRIHRDDVKSLRQAGFIEVGA